MSINAYIVDNLEPGSPEWLRTISASKVPAILGLSPWESRFSLWHRMNGSLAKQEETDTTRRGHYLEPAVAAWFSDQHPELSVSLGHPYAHHRRHDWTATPDRLAWHPEHLETVGVEIKSAIYDDEWGTEHTAEIPPYYLAQVAWQMIVTGLRKVHVPIITGHLVFKEYVVTWADVVKDVPYIIGQVHAFQTSLASGTAPDIDESGATYQAIRDMHPDIDGEKIDLPDNLAYNFLTAKTAADYAQAAADKYKNLIADHMGTAKTAVWNGSIIFNRQARNGGTPYLVVARKLPTINEQIIERKAS